MELLSIRNRILLKMESFVEKFYKKVFPIRLFPLIEKGIFDKNL